MSQTHKLHAPWLVAVWPGMGNVAVIAGYYLMSKLGMHLLAEFSPRALFDAEHVDVNGGLISSSTLPRSRLFVWHNDNQQHDVVLFIGEAQPPLGKYTFCRQLLEFTRQLGVEQVFTFAAMATPMRIEDPSRVFTAATDEKALQQMKQMQLVSLEDGHIGGLNGVLLGVAAEQGLRGACLLGEMPQVFPQFPFPKASVAVLEAFTNLAGIEVDLRELTDHSQQMETKLGELLSQVEQAMELADQEEEEESFASALADQQGLDSEERQRLEQLFAQAEHDRSKAYVLKQELDKLDVFAEYEDRFLDLFKKPRRSRGEPEGSTS